MGLAAYPYKFVKNDKWAPENISQNLYKCHFFYELCNLLGTKCWKLPIFDYIRYLKNILNEYRIFEYQKKQYSLDALDPTQWWSDTVTANGSRQYSLTTVVISYSGTHLVQQVSQWAICCSMWTFYSSLDQCWCVLNCCHERFVTISNYHCN